MHAAWNCCTCRHTVATYVSAHANGHVQWIILPGREQKPLLSAGCPWADNSVWFARFWTFALETIWERHILPSRGAAGLMRDDVTIGSIRGNKITFGATSARDYCCWSPEKIRCHHRKTVDSHRDDFGGRWHRLCVSSEERATVVLVHSQSMDALILLLSVLQHYSKTRSSFTSAIHENVCSVNRSWYHDVMQDVTSNGSDRVIAITCTENAQTFRIRIRIL